MVTVLFVFQRDEAKCPALPHACTCSQDSKGPPGPPGPAVRKYLFISCLPYVSYIILICGNTGKQREREGFATELTTAKFYREHL